MRQLPRREAEGASLFDALVRRLRELTGIGEQETGNLRDAIEEIIGEAPADERKDFTAEQRALLLNALEFGELGVDDVMVPRADIKAVPVEATLREVVRAMHEAGHTRLLVYRETLDDVLGLVHVKDLLPYWGDGAEFDLERVVRPVLMVPPSMRVLDLLLDMRKSRVSLAVVVDEFGGTDGLVTMEDLVEEIVGELRGREAQPGRRLLELPDGSLEVDARLDLEELEERLGTPLLDEDERDEADTLAGLIFALVDRVPAKGEVVPHPAGFAFEVLDADPRRIKRVRIRRSPPPDAAPTNGPAPEGK